MNDFLPHITASIDDTLASLVYFYPELWLTAGFLLVIISDLFLSSRYGQLTFWLSLLVIAGEAVICFGMLGSPPVSLFGGMIVLDKLAQLIKILLCFVSLIFVFFVRYNKALQEGKKGISDLFSILLAVQLGMNLMVMSGNLLMVYLSIEMVSVGSYLMTGYLAKDAKQSEASLKYALFGGTCSAIMLYGMSLIYAFTGSLDLYGAALVAGLQQVPAFVSGLAILMVMAGIAFKLALVPFHFWSPDVYEGAPTPVTAFLSTGPKIAGFALLIRFISGVQTVDLTDSLLSLNTVLAVMGIGSMIIGNFAAIWQNNVKRMLAYSSIGHTGFMLMAVFILSDSGIKALLFYLCIYAIMNMAVFMIADEIEERSGRKTNDGYRGLGKKMPLLMTAMVVVLISLTGLPPTVGFTAKFLVFSAALNSYNLSGSVALMILIITGVLSTLVSLFYYFKIPLNAFLREDAENIPLRPPGPKTYMGVFLAFLLLILIIFPSIIEQFL